MDDELCGRMFTRAKYHRIVAGITVGSAIFLLLFGIGILLWKFERKVEGEEIGLFLTDGIFRIVLMSLVVFSSQILVSMYSFNMKSYGHWVSRAYALELAKSCEGKDIENFERLVTALDSSGIDFMKLPKRPLNVSTPT